MKVTVCQWPNRVTDYETSWRHLVEHVRSRESGLVLLPETPFFPWMAVRGRFDLGIWRDAVSAHAQWRARFSELGPTVVCGSAPVNEKMRRLNQAFVWDPAAGYRGAHAKFYLPSEKGFWERNWFDRGDGRFLPVAIRDLKLGFVICTDIWFFQHARAYARADVHILLCPRATQRETLDNWLVAGRAAAVVSGAYCLSSNRISDAKEEADLGGQGWIIGPDGEVMAQTSGTEPVVTVEIDPRSAARAKTTYPRYVLE